MCNPHAKHSDINQEVKTMGWSVQSTSLSPVSTHDHPSQRLLIGVINVDLRVEALPRPFSEILLLLLLLLYLCHNIISVRLTFPEVLVKIRHDDIILWHMTSFSYIFPYYDVIDKSADVSKNNDITVKVIIENECSNVTLLPCNTPSPLHMYYGF